MIKKIGFNYLLILLLVLVDIFNINQLWNENYIRRTLHHLPRSLYTPTKIPEIYLDQKLSQQDIIFLQNLKYKNKKNLANTKYPLIRFSNRYLFKSRYFYNDFDVETKKD